MPRPMSITAPTRQIAVPEPGARGLVLHASWVPPLGRGQHLLAVWAEAQTAPRAYRRTALLTAPPARPRSHPFAGTSLELEAALRRLWRAVSPGSVPHMAHLAKRLLIWLPSAGARPMPSPEMLRASWATDPTAYASDGAHAAALPLALWRVDALLLDPQTVGALLGSLPLDPLCADALQPSPPEPADAMPRMRVGDDLRLWRAAARFTLGLLVRQHVVPGALVVPEAESGYGYSSGPGVASFWFASLHDPADRKHFSALAQSMPDLCRAAVPPGMTYPDTHNVPHAAALLEDFIHRLVSAWVQAWLRSAHVELRLAGTSARAARMAEPYYSYYASQRSLATRWLAGLAMPGQDFAATPAEVKAVVEGMPRWHQRLGGAGRAAFRLCLRLTPPAREDVPAPPAPDGHDPRAPLAPLTPADDMTPTAVVEPPHTTDGRQERAWQIEYLLQARDDPSLLVPLAELWRVGGAVAEFLDRRFEHPHEQVLMSLGLAAHAFPPLERSLRQRTPTACAISGVEAYDFLRHALPQLEARDIGVQAPSWWKRATAKPAVRLKLRGTQKVSSGLLGLDAVVGFDWKVALGGAELGLEELEQLATLKEPLVRLRGQWMEIEPAQVEAALAFARKHASGDITLGQALRTALTGQLDEDSIELEDVSADEWIGPFFARLNGGDVATDVPSPAGLCGTLRPYQERGLSWLAFLARYGLGACLADDMGLGKTIQLLALVLHAKHTGQLTKPVLLVCPTSVVGNWRHEAERFTPELRVLIHHGAERVGRADRKRFAAAAAGHDLVVTTYGLLPRDAEALANVEWGAVVLDEAQNIKSVEAKQTRAARRLHAPLRMALTGTPVENHLDELWSIMDFLNPGYLGARKRFHERFAYPIERLHDAELTTRLQRMVRPFVLRRLKTDPTVIQDLPQKVEIREYCALTREQITLYEAVVRDGLRQIEEAISPMQRRGVVLSLLVKLKQVCNHPAHFLGDGSALAGRSGKVQRLEELIEELLTEGDRALIFTQFTAMGERLAPYLRERFGTEVLYLHGAVPRHQREAMVERFQSADGPPLFLLSLKAGSTGLNLTRANHVIHFDRWWNPAVENQATDRAFRIGQQHNVQVRKFVCSGTLEERIDAMIEQKRELAEHVIGTGEGWLTELSTAELREMFSLRAEALVD